MAQPTLVILAASARTEILSAGQSGAKPDLIVSGRDFNGEIRIIEIPDHPFFVELCSFLKRNPGS
jgi:hypothetical protein